MSERLGPNEAFEQAGEVKRIAEGLASFERSSDVEAKHYQLASNLIDAWVFAPDETEAEVESTNTPLEVNAQAEAINPEEAPREELDWEIIPLSEWPDIQAKVIAQLSQRKKGGAEAITPEELEAIASRLKYLEELAILWKDQGGTIAEHSFPGRREIYLAVFRQRTLDDGSIVEDAVADCGFKHNALYALRGDEGNWRDVFQNGKPKIREIFEKENIGKRLYHTSSYRERLDEYMNPNG